MSVWNHFTYTLQDFNTDMKIQLKSADFSYIHRWKHNHIS